MPKYYLPKCKGLLCTVCPEKNGTLTLTDDVFSYICTDYAIFALKERKFSPLFKYIIFILKLEIFGPILQLLS